MFFLNEHNKKQAQEQKQRNAIPIGIIKSTLELDIQPILEKYPFPEEKEQARKVIIEKSVKFEVSYFHCNPDSLDTIVFLHGNSTSANMFNSLLEHYKANYRVVAPTYLGHAGSTQINSLKNLTDAEKKLIAKVLYNPFCMIATLIHFFDKINIEHAHLLGYSLGGHFAYGIAKEKPTLVNSVVTYASPPVKFSKSGLEKGFARFFLDLIEKWCTQPTEFSLEDAIKIASDIGFSNPTNEYNPIDDLIDADPLMRQGLFLQREKLDEECFNNSVIDAESVLKEIDVPVSLLVGQHDISIRKEAIEATAKLNKVSVTHQVVPEANHNLFSFKEFITMFDTFLKKCLPGSNIFPEQRPRSLS